MVDQQDRDTAVAYVAAAARPARGSRCCRDRRPVRRAGAAWGSPARARATETSWRCPWESSDTCRSRRSLRPSSSRTAVECRRVVGDGRVLAHLDVLLDREIVGDAGQLEGAGQPEGRPAVGRQVVDALPEPVPPTPHRAEKPHRASIVVVLPAPFGPINPTIWPSSTAEAHVVDRDHAAVAHGQVRTSRSGLDLPHPPAAPLDPTPRSRRVACLGVTARARAGVGGHRRRGADVRPCATGMPSVSTAPVGRAIGAMRPRTPLFEGQMCRPHDALGVEDDREDHADAGDDAVPVVDPALPDARRDHRRPGARPR